MNKNTYFTLVFKSDSFSEQERRTLVEKCSVASWGHAINERKALETEVERLQLQLAACGVVAMANTPESAARQRDMHPDYMSASCQDVIAAVDREIALREEVERLRSEIEMRKLHVTGAAKVIQEEKNDNAKLREELSAQKVISESYMSERDRYKELADERLETLADVEQQRDQLKAAVTLAIDTFRRYDMDVETYPTIDHIKMMRNLKGVLATHDAEVVELARAYVTSEISSNSPCEDYDSALGDYANQLRQKAQSETPLKDSQ